MKWANNLWDKAVNWFSGTSLYKGVANNIASNQDKVLNAFDLSKSKPSSLSSVVDKVTGEGSFLGNVSDTLDGDNQKENNQLLLQAALQQMQYQTQSAERAMQFNAEQAQLNRDFQERLSSTAYRRAVEDLKSAGLNPILAYTNFSPSSTPSGSSATGYAQSGAKADVDLNNYLPDMLLAIGGILSNSSSALSVLSKIKGKR